MSRRKISGFQYGKRKLLDQGQGSVVYSKINMYSHADTIVCVSKCIVMDFTSKKCDAGPYSNTYKTLKSVPIVQVATAYNNPDTGETTIQILDEAIWVGDIMDHTLVNPNQLCAYRMIVQENRFAEAPIFIATEDHDFILILPSKGTILGVTTRSR